MKTLSKNFNCTNIISETQIGSDLIVEKPSTGVDIKVL